MTVQIMRPSIGVLNITRALIIALTTSTWFVHSKYLDRIQGGYDET